MTSPLHGDEAQRLVAAAYGARDLFGSDADVVSWSQRLRADQPAADIAPQHFAVASVNALRRDLNDAGVIRVDGGLDEYRLREFQQVIALLPFVWREEESRRPPERPKIVFTVPPSVALPKQAAHMQLSLAERVFDALVSSAERTLLASPFWSDKGAEVLWAPLQTSVDLGLPVTLAGAKRDAERDDLQAMLRLAAKLKAEGTVVRALQFVPPNPASIFHAKVVAGTVGYLGSANLTTSGLSLHVETGLPLDEPDVEQVWWLLDILVGAGLLRDVVI
jgi:hypothetical protein